MWSFVFKELSDKIDVKAAFCFMNTENIANMTPQTKATQQSPWFLSFMSF